MMQAGGPSSGRAKAGRLSCVDQHGGEVVALSTNMDEEIAQWISAAVSLGAVNGMAG